MSMSAPIAILALKTKRITKKKKINIIERERKKYQKFFSEKIKMQRKNNVQSVTELISRSKKFYPAFPKVYKKNLPNKIQDIWTAKATELGKKAA